MTDHHLTVTEQTCLRNALRRSGRILPPSPEGVAKPLADEELADLIHHLTDILQQRLRDKPSEGSGLKRQIDAARIEVRSWGTARQQQIERYLYPNGKP